MRKPGLLNKLLGPEARFDIIINFTECCRPIVCPANRDNERIDDNTLVVTRCRARSAVLRLCVTFQLLRVIYGTGRRKYLIRAHDFNENTSEVIIFSGGRYYVLTAFVIIRFERKVFWNKLITPSTVIIIILYRVREIF